MSMGLPRIIRKLVLVLLIAAREALSVTIEKQGMTYPFFNAPLEVLTTSGDPEINIKATILGSDRVVVGRIWVQTHTVGIKNVQAIYSEVSITGLTNGPEHTESFHVIVGCNNELEALPNHNRFDGFQSVSLGLHEECRIYLGTDSRDNVQIQRVVRGMPSKVSLFLKKGDSAVELALDMDIRLPPGGIGSGFQCKEIENFSSEPPLPAFIAYDGFYTELTESSVDDSAPPEISVKQDEKSSLIALTVQYKDQPMLESTIECGDSLTKLEEDNWIYSFDREDRFCFAISKIPEKQLVQQFKMLLIDSMLYIDLWFDSSDSQPSRKFKVTVKLLGDGCPLDEPASDLQPLDASTFSSLSELKFGEISAHDLIFEKTSDGAVFSKFPGSTTDQYSIPSVIAGFEKYFIERVVVHYVTSPNDQLPPNTMLLVLSVLDKTIKEPPMYYGRLGVLVICLEKKIAKLPKNYAPLGENCAVDFNVFGQPETLTLTDSGKRTIDNVPVVEFNIEDGEGNKFIWRIYNNILSAPVLENAALVGNQNDGKFTQNQDDHQTPMENPDTLLVPASTNAHHNSPQTGEKQTTETLQETAIAPVQPGKPQKQSGPAKENTPETVLTQRTRSNPQESTSNKKSSTNAIQPSSSADAIAALPLTSTAASKKNAASLKISPPLLTLVIAIVATAALI